MCAWTASRVNSRESETEKPLHRDSELTRESHLLAQSIPYWPRVVEIVDLAKKLGMNTKAVDRRVVAIQERYLVFQDGRWCSRLKPDLSNVDADRCVWEVPWR